MPQPLNGTHRGIKGHTLLHDQHHADVGPLGLLEDRMNRGERPFYGDMGIIRLVTQPLPEDAIVSRDDCGSHEFCP